MWNWRSESNHWEESSFSCPAHSGCERACIAASARCGAAGDKNLYLLYQGRIGRMLAVVAWLWDCLPALALVAACVWLTFARTSGVAVWMALACFVLALARQWHYGKALARLGFDPSLANYQPMGAALLGALVLNSLWAHRITGSIAWKGRHYATEREKKIIYVTRRAEFCLPLLSQPELHSGRESAGVRQVQ